MWIYYTSGYVAWLVLEDDKIKMLLKVPIQPLEMRTYHVRLTPTLVLNVSREYWKAMLTYFVLGENALLATLKISSNATPLL